MKLFHPASERLVFESQYFPKTYLFSRTYASENTEHAFQISPSCDLQTAAIVDLKRLD